MYRIALKSDPERGISSISTTGIYFDKELGRQKEFDTFEDAKSFFEIWSKRTSWNWDAFEIVPM